ncbi:MAG: hypothetical protein IJ830_02470 [Alphaproteobacteria bacterium]|nr:hypothetical protein [Alphaproteobacteria bacterium]
MKKIIFIFALAMFLSANVNAADRDCAQYSTSEALAATSDSSTNTVSFVFSGMTARKGTTNADCAAASSSPAEPATPATPEEEHDCPPGQGWYIDRCISPEEHSG